MSKTAQKAADKTAALKDLRKLCPKGSTVFCILRNVSRSGMSRVISFKIIRKGEISNLDYLISIALDYAPAKNHDGLKVGGCGMDMGFSVVYNLSSALYGSEDRGSYAVSHRWI